MHDYHAAAERYIAAWNATDADARTQGAQQQPHEHQAGADQQENVQ